MDSDDGGEKHGIQIRAKDRQSTEQSLLKASLDIFSSKGFEKATTKAIAQKAGCAEALIHRYFGSKEKLLLAVFRCLGAGDKASSISDLPATSSVFDEVR